MAVSNLLPDFGNRLKYSTNKAKNGTLPMSATKANADELNAAVYALFHLTPEEVVLIDRDDSTQGL